MCDPNRAERLQMKRDRIAHQTGSVQVKRTGG